MFVPKALTFLLFSSVVLGAALPEEVEEPITWPEPGKDKNGTTSWGEDYAPADCGHVDGRVYPYVPDPSRKLHLTFDPRIQALNSDDGRWMTVTLQNGPQNKVYRLQCADEGGEEDGDVDRWTTIPIPAEDGADHLNIQVKPGSFCDREDKDWTDGDVYDDLEVKVGSVKKIVAEDCPMETCIASQDWNTDTLKMNYHTGDVAHCYFL